jgi:outer membrane receptor protein involved in Fe transport
MLRWATIRILRFADFRWIWLRGLRSTDCRQPGYNLLNIGARYTPSGEWKKVTFRLFADNVMNKRYWKDTGASYGDTFLHLGAPTTVRLSAQYNF